MLLELVNIKKSYSGLSVIEGLNFTIRHNDIKVIIGPNGAGKSTLFRIISGSEICDSGRIHFRDINICKLSPNKRAQLGIGISMQIPDHSDHLTIHELVYLATGKVKLSGVFIFDFQLDDKNQEILNTFKLNFWKTLNPSKNVGQLSHAERKKLDILIALISSKHLCLLDEPTAGLGELEQLNLIKLIKVLKDKRTFLIIEHNMNFLKLLNEDISFMNDGRILTSGSFFEISQNKSIRNIYLGDDI